jgi:hypothetical protein
MDLVTLAELRGKSLDSDDLFALQMSRADAQAIGHIALRELLDVAVEQDLVVALTPRHRWASRIGLEHLDRFLKRVPELLRRMGAPLEAEQPDQRALAQERGIVKAL